MKNGTDEEHLENRFPQNPNLMHQQQQRGDAVRHRAHLDGDKFNNYFGAVQEDAGRCVCGRGGGCGGVEAA